MHGEDLHGSETSHEREELMFSNVVCLDTDDPRSLSYKPQLALASEQRASTHFPSALTTCM